MSKENDIEEIKEIIKKGMLSKLFSGDTNNTFIQFFRYCFVGGVATIADWGVSYLLFHFVFNDNLAVEANVISFVVGLIVNYTLSTSWIFKNSNVDNRLVEFAVFAAIGLVGLLLTAGVTKLFWWKLSDVTNLYQIIGKIVSTVVAFLWNFFARKFVLFN